MSERIWRDRSSLRQSTIVQGLGLLFLFMACDCLRLISFVLKVELISKPMQILRIVSYLVILSICQDYFSYVLSDVFIPLGCPVNNLSLCNMQITFIITRLLPKSHWMQKYPQSTTHQRHIFL